MLSADSSFDAFALTSSKAFGYKLPAFLPIAGPRSRRSNLAFAATLDCHMSSERINEFDALPVGGPDLDARPRWRKVLDEVVDRLKHNPLQNLTIILAVIAAVTGLSLGLLLLVPETLGPSAPPPLTLADALAALDAEDFGEARRIAADLRLVDDLPEKDVGGPAYVLGVVMAREGEIEWERREKRLLLLLATRYHEEARKAGFPEGRQGHGLQAYSTATNRFQHEPESLEAYVQIANCHRRKDRHAEARGTLEQAKVVLSRIRPDADFTQTTRYDRKQWTELLDWLGAL